MRERVRLQGLVLVDGKELKAIELEMTERGCAGEGADVGMAMKIRPFEGTLRAQEQVRDMITATWWRRAARRRGRK